MSPLPLCRTPTRMQNGEYDDDISFHREAGNRVRYSSSLRTCEEGGKVPRASARPILV